MAERADPSALVVRSLRREDAPAAASLAAELVRQHHRYDPARFMQIEPIEPGYERFLERQSGRADAVVLVAELGGRIVGDLLAGLEERDWSDLRDACGKVHDVFVAPGVRGRGVGERLVEEAVARLKALGAPRVVLMTAWQNEPARRFFARLGFRETMLEMTRETP